MSTEYTLILVRHGESEWNKMNKFCGWHDADLSEAGVEEAKYAAELIKSKGYQFDVAFTSVLKRAIKTLYLIQDGTDLHWVPVYRSWRLNERHYGGLQGLNKAETAVKHGENQVKFDESDREVYSSPALAGVMAIVKIWRRSYATPPPPLSCSDPEFSGNDPKYAKLDPNDIPTCECLKDTVARVLPYWSDAIVPELKDGKTVLISAHGNSLRALVKYLDKMSEDDIMGLNIPTGIPLIYKLDKNLKPTSHFYLASEEEVKIAQEKVAAQGKAK